MRLLNGRISAIGDYDCPIKGREYLVVVREHVGPGLPPWGYEPKDLRRIVLFDTEKYPNGIPGNSNPRICRFHGWRGTWNDSASFAMGIRKCIRAKLTASGEVVASFGPDLIPELE